MNLTRPAVSASLVLLLAGCGSAAGPAGSASVVPPVASAPASPAPSGQLVLKEVVSEPIGQDTVEVLAFSPDGKRLALGAADGTVAVYSLQVSATEDAVKAQKLHGRFTSSIAWSPFGDRVLSAASDGAAIIGDPNTMQPLQRFNTDPASYPAGVWSPDGQKIALAQGRDSVQVYDLHGNAEPETLSLPGATRALLWLPSGELAASDDKGKVTFFKPGNPTPVRAYTPAQSHKAVNGLSLSPADGSLAIAYDDGTIILLDPSTGKEVRQLTQGRQTGSVAWSPNGKVLAETSVAFAVTFFDSAGKRLASLDIGHDMNGVSWSPDGALVAAGSDDHTFKIWQVSPAQTPGSGKLPPQPSYMGR
ncbi:MAG TPA: hypothetical protein VK009_09260 [Chloroflexota bacterium]|nr:hypothetical protein [Chloroflexota bacterium]